MFTQNTNFWLVQNIFLKNYVDFGQHLFMIKPFSCLLGNTPKCFHTNNLIFNWKRQLFTWKNGLISRLKFGFLSWDQSFPNHQLFFPRCRPSRRHPWREDARCPGHLSGPGPDRGELGHRPAAGDLPRLPGHHAQHGQAALALQPTQEEHRPRSQQPACGVGPGHSELGSRGAGRRPKHSLNFSLKTLFVVFSYII